VRGNAIQVMEFPQFAATALQSNRLPKKELTRLEQSTENLPNSGMMTQRAIALYYQ